MTVSTQSERARLEGRFIRLVAISSVIVLGCGNAPDTNHPIYASETTSTTTIGATTGASGSSAASAGSGGTNSGFDAGNDGANGLGGSGGAGSSADGGAVVGARCNPSIDWMPIGRIDSIPVQLARFRSLPDSVDLYFATRPPVDAIRRSATWLHAQCALRRVRSSR